MKKKINNKKQLEILLEQVPKHPNPKVELEQYNTPSIIASDLLWNAKVFGDLEDKKVLDLACGTGIFALGSSLIGAKFVNGFDIDKDSLNIGMDMASKFELNNVKFHNCDLEKIDTLNEFKGDTLFQNPPFGSQKMGKKGIDTNFIDLAVNCADVVYSFHMASTEEYIINYFLNLGCKVENTFHYHFPLSKTYKFHTKESYNVDVVVIRAKT